jgi:hypothetical protein
MTTYFDTNETCAHCGTESEQTALGSTNAFGSSDLDLRPPEMKRSTMSTWVQVCPSCGYVAPNLATPVPDRDVLTSTLYRDQLDDNRYPELARRFLAWSLLLAGTNPDLAGQACLYAAWVCDDHGPAELAAACRSRAAEHIERGKPFPDTQQGVTRGAVLVDILRRAGRFAEAGKECEALLACTSARDILRQVLEFQQGLIARGDIAAHAVQEALPQAVE